jgi:hypothetical protein
LRERRSKNSAVASEAMLEEEKNGAQIMHRRTNAKEYRSAK